MAQLRRSRLPIVGLVLAGSSLWILRALDANGLVPVWLPVVVGQALFTLCYSLLLRAFAGSLRRGEEPLIASIARRMRGKLAPEIERYTRAVTIVWSALFAFELVASFALLILAPLKLWSGFVTWVSLTLVVLTLVIEYIVRRIRLRHHPRDRLRDVAKVVRMAMAATSK